MKHINLWVGGTLAAAAAVGLACAAGEVEVDCEKERCVEVASGVAVPECTVQTPDEGAEVSAPSINVTVNVTNFRLGSKGTCSGEAPCGHLHLSLEGCSASAESTTGSAKLDVSGCAEGEKVLNVVLHDDSHAIYVKNGVALADSVTFRLEGMEVAHSGGSGGDCDCDSDSDSDKSSDKDSDSDCDSH